MARITVEAGRDIAAPPARVFTCLADFAQHRPRWLPPNYSELAVEQGGAGAGAVVRYRLKVGPRERVYHMRITVPRAGSTVVEQDTGSSMIITWTVTPRGAESQVSVAAQWQGGSGFGGFMERMFAPGGLRRVFDDALSRLAQYAATVGGPTA